MRNREFIQILAIVLCFGIYLIGKNYLNPYESIPTGFYHWGILVPVAAVGFAMVAWTIAWNVFNQAMSKLDRIISFAILVLLSFFSLAIMIDFLKTDLFRDPMFLPSVGVLVLVVSAIFINTRK